jgi:hypothetical protein
VQQGRICCPCQRGGLVGRPCPVGLMVLQAAASYTLPKLNPLVVDARWIAGGCQSHAAVVTSLSTHLDCFMVCCIHHIHNRLHTPAVALPQAAETRLQASSTASTAQGRDHWCARVRKLQHLHILSCSNCLVAQHSRLRPLLGPGLLRGLCGPPLLHPARPCPALQLPVSPAAAVCDFRHNTW